MMCYCIGMGIGWYCWASCFASYIPILFFLNQRFARLLLFRMSKISHWFDVSETCILNRLFCLTHIYKGVRWHHTVWIVFGFDLQDFHLCLLRYYSFMTFFVMCQFWTSLLFWPEGWAGSSDVFPLSGILRLSFDSIFLSDLLSCYSA